MAGSEEQPAVCVKSRYKTAEETHISVCGW